MALAPDGTLYIADSGNHRLCRLKDGQVTELAGGSEGRADGTGPAARFRWPAALALAPDHAWVADAGNGVARRVDPGGQVTTPVPPPAVAAALGLVAPANPPAPIFASRDARAVPEGTEYGLGRASSHLGSDTLAVFGDVDHHVLMAQRPGEPLLIAGIREAEPASADGIGNRAAFALPVAVVLAADGTAYVAESRGQPDSRVTLPGLAGPGRAADEELAAAAVLSGRHGRAGVDRRLRRWVLRSSI